MANLNIKKVIIPVAGFGTRFLPATKAQPKEMLPIVDKPVIQYLVEEAVASGINEIIFVTGRGKRAIEDHFDNAAELEYFLEKRGKHELAREIRKISSLANFAFVRQKEPRGNGDALLQAFHLIKDEPVAVLFGDDVVYSKTPCLKQLIVAFKKYKAPIFALERVPMEQVYKYGIVNAKKVATRTYRINAVVEKPAVKDAPSDLSIVGKYILTPDVFYELSRLEYKSGKELELTEAFKKMLKHGKKIYGYEFEGTRYDCGDKLGLLKAVVDFGLRHPDVGKGLREHLYNLH
ncbi:MAG: UTP--glucose-1-phosphate uridylyltransferase [Candidatus Sungbacteria bacterium RIFCSPLOWO2_02_FULL_47_9]|uniref:UTP--glucose-1-phosphate uridylyltransferase n=1 Tax=Candidatus Sungbacteria bacterium RIFCSPHIGHO2_01_FULL_47_32 TaxID=1802264 RepID=A0A1G2K5A9_9BACT|nr:MAG: UTP--glucose-1-phosphate uridylyltransferase [Candidatus Sungbacteria bacterium RIFCSPHIGHO2_01_FULL_47_32]OGZ98696.1 MAG: UTP--glucose-1-phosphate uridylyltransferase [Candidatus Sungbacteria bacterium RIFCSPHIGHO2_02_FULL_46_12]OHA04846.1 MAG: UTP--glucose-1-phosphate uridylyltransferase [Candidatus Sungbacteria bacterium RIFCSPLOWO2_01_FULL_47_32]OHA11678.1 MAG: UTP--glucose-1-phosphate uridylyltransferase [Candidatus Sungbacteria bacterium RIFCSPLOWO2_02_FULL_47_9]